MKINITITIALVCVSTFCMAQISDFDVTWSEKIEAKKTLVSDIFSTGDLSTFYSVNTAYRFGGSTTVLEKYENLKPVNDRTLRCPGHSLECTLRGSPCNYFRRGGGPSSPTAAVCGGC